VDVEVGAVFCHAEWVAMMKKLCKMKDTNDMLWGSMTRLEQSHVTNDEQ
jgi:hypothetical protein